MLERFTDKEIVNLVAYQNLYGPITPNRLDMVAARLGMDIAAPNMKKGSRPKFKDHLMVWSKKPFQKTPAQILETIKGIQRAYDEIDDAKVQQRKKAAEAKAKRNADRAEQRASRRRRRRG